MSEQRIAIIGKLKPHSLARAEEIVEQGPPLDLGGSAITRHSVFVCSDFVVFVFEGPDIEYAVHGLVDHPVAAASSASGGLCSTGCPGWRTSASSGQPRRMDEPEPR